MQIQGSQQFGSSYPPKVYGTGASLGDPITSAMPLHSEGMAEQKQEAQPGSSTTDTDVKASQVFQFSSPQAAALFHSGAVTMESTAEKLCMFLEENKSSLFEKMRETGAEYLTLTHENVSITVRKKNESLRYYINTKKVLGSGTSKVVYEYYHYKKDKTLAFGELIPDTKKDVIGLARKEFKITNRLNGSSDFIIQAKFWVTVTKEAETQTHSVVTERCHGTWADLIKLPLSREQKISVMLQTLAGFAQIHKTGYVHRDVKPENIFYKIDKDGNIIIKIADFGFGCKKTWKEKYRFVGSPLFFSPEFCQMLAGKRGMNSIDQTKNDLWALGLLFHELYKGVKPQHLEVAERVNPPYDRWVRLLSQLGLISGLNPQDPIEAVISHMLDCDPQNRCSAEDALNEMMLIGSQGRLSDLISMPLSEKQKISIMKQLLKGFAEMHEKGYVHQNVKMENIYYTKDQEGNVTIQIAEPLFRCKKEWKDRFHGTALFLSPELCQALAMHDDLSAIDQTKIDIWSLGLIFYQLYKGQKPTHLRIAERVNPSTQSCINVIKTIRNISGLNSEDPIEAIIGAMLNCDPEKRCSAMAALERMPATENLGENPLDNT